MAWNHFLRLFNAHSSAAPMIYVAAPTVSINGTHHIHALLWSYAHGPVVRSALRKSGFHPTPALKAVKSSRTDVHDLVHNITYVLGQTETVFGESTSSHNEPVAAEKRKLLMNHASTLRHRNPELLHALHDARSKTVSDAELIARTPWSRDKQ